MKKYMKDFGKTDEKYEELDSSLNNDVAFYLKQLNAPLLSPDEEKELAIKISLGDVEAKNLFIESNLRLVVSIAKQYRNRGISFIDLIQEGNLGLLKAVSYYDVKFGFRFSTYAVWHIHAAISRAVGEYGKLIRTPYHFYKKIIKFRIDYAVLCNKLGRNPTLYEVSNYFNISLEDVQMLVLLQEDILSLNHFLFDDEDEEMEQVFISDMDSPEDVAIQRCIESEFVELFRSCQLTNREINVLMMRFGFIDGRIFTYDEIAQEEHVTRQAICSCEQRALKKIRNSSCIDRFAAYMDFPEKALQKIRKLRR